jgi:hypothetical protein
MKMWRQQRRTVRPTPLVGRRRRRARLHGTAPAASAASQQRKVRAAWRRAVANRRPRPAHHACSTGGRSARHPSWADERRRRISRSRNALCVQVDVAVSLVPRTTVLQSHSPFLICSRCRQRDVGMAEVWAGRVRSRSHSCRPPGGAAALTRCCPGPHGLHQRGPLLHLLQHGGVIEARTVAYCRRVVRELAVTLCSFITQCLLEISILNRLAQR